MLNIITLAKRTLIISLAVVLTNVSLVSTLTFADDCPPPSSSDAGVHEPTGSDAGQFVYQCSGDYAGKWLSAYYVYDPATNRESPLPGNEPVYSYDCSQNQWYVSQWKYSPGRGAYTYQTMAAYYAPDQATGCPVATAGGGGGSGGIGSDQSSSNTGPDSSNSTTNDLVINGTTVNNNNLLMNNGILSFAGSGNAGIFGNTTGGSALTGDAMSLANIANLLQSTSNVFGPGLQTFTANINGDVTGDFMFDPNATLNKTGPDSSNTAANNLQINTNNTNNTNAQINNNIDVGAVSGDATVAHNTTGGDATSGNAQAIVNLMNMINSTVASGQSFLGTININGNLDGDILLPPDFVNQLIAATGPNSSNTATNNVTTSSTTTNNINEAITNAINSSAQSGAATVSGNTTGGSAASGLAGTNVTMLNLTGSSVVGKNNMLVFVNVLGRWVGMIVDAPAGSTAASLGGGINNTGPNSSNNTSNNVTANSTTTNNANLGINNNVNVHAQSGDATVTGNTTGGNATSGDANTAVNVLNIMGSNINLSDWFGVLFINVFGSWNGSFGVNTAAGNPAPAAPSGTNAGTPATFQFVPGGTAAAAAGTSSASSSPLSTATGSGGGSAASSAKDGVVLAAKSVQKVAASASEGLSPNQKAANTMILPAVGVAIAFLILLASERNRFMRRNR